MTQWTNDDGLIVNFGLSEGDKGLVGASRTAGATKQLVVVVEASRMSLTGGLFDNRSRTALPAGARITAATLVVTEAFDSGGSATLDLGLANADGTYTNLDEDGIDVAIAETAIDTAGKVVVCDGALVAATSAARTTVIGYPSYDLDTLAFTTGKGYLVIEYDEQPYTDQGA